MALLSGLLAMVLVGPTSKADLPLGTWRVQIAGRVSGDLVITEVKPDRTLCGTAFGKPLVGSWDGEVLSFSKQTDDGEALRAGVQRLSISFAGRLVREQQGEKVRYTLTGTETRFITGCYIHTFLPSREWKAHLEAPDHQK
jgi:hypothetical protein